jgi:hypothetical protein
LPVDVSRFEQAYQQHADYITSRSSKKTLRDLPAFLLQLLRRYGSPEESAFDGASRTALALLV